MSRAAVFTHLDERNRLEDSTEFERFYRRRGAFFRSCLRCPNVGIVFIYSSFGIEQYLAALEASGVDAKIPMKVLENEQRIYNTLQVALDHAIVDVRTGHPSWSGSDAPPFVFIGVRELACHLNRLRRINPELLKNFAYRGRFTYDSPKYVEAILRIRRAQLFPTETIVRIDADVLVDEKSIAVILDQAAVCSREQEFKQFWWFSGCYSGNTVPDPINDHAVRQHWLITRESRHDPDRRYQLVQGGEHFLADIAEVGATQYGLVDERKAAPPVSAAGQSLIRRRGRSKRRAAAQVISGAGLVASYEAIRRLPPFMNAKEMVVWIDDHLKRLLHEAIGDISPDAPERLIEAALRQDRFPEGIPEEMVTRSAEYFERLMRGCLMEATIQTAAGSAGPLAEWVKEVVWDRLKKLSSNDMKRLRRELEAAAKQRFNEVIELWGRANYGDKALRKWTQSGPSEDLWKDVVEIGVAYVDLCLRWSAHVRAIGDLSANEA
ncbi:MAG TPA: hypothetical protein VF713_06070, partial [Thermoanaerobaculia bacterium]